MECLYTLLGSYSTGFKLDAATFSTNDGSRPARLLIQSFMVGGLSSPLLNCHTLPVVFCKYVGKIAKVGIL